MPGEKRFRTSFIGGFKKSDVNVYIEKILKEFDEKLKTKDDEITVFRNQNKDLKYKLEEVSKKTDEIGESRTKIADVLIQAQENAEKILESARIQADNEKRQLEEIIEKDKEKIVDIRTEIKTLKSEIVTLLKKYEQQLSDLVKEEDEAQAQVQAQTEVQAEAAAASDIKSDIDFGSLSAQSYISDPVAQPARSSLSNDYDPGFTRY